MRKLVTVRKVREIIPIENADNIELAKIDGWQCVVKKGEFKVGDLGVYFEIDSFLPIEEKYEFLRKPCYKKMADSSEGYRLKTIKLRGTLSQGLLLPLNIFDLDFEIVEGMDLTEKLNVRLYEPPIPAQLQGKIKGMFPSFIRKTDQERIQNLSDYFEKYKDVKFECSEKLDGSSMTVYYKDRNFGIGSRNLELLEEENNTLWKIVRILDLERLMKEYSKNIALQGEIVGEGIQGNPYKLIGQKFYLFDIFDIDTGRHLTPEKRMEIYEWFKHRSNIEHVPIIAIRTIFQDFQTMDLLLGFVGSDVSRLNSKTLREGLVFKSCDYVDNDIVSFKVVNSEYLLKEG